MNKRMKTKNNIVRSLIGLLLATLLIFATLASAEEPVTDDTTAIDVASAGAFASATGSEAIVKTEAIVTSTEASAKATAKAMAEDGGTATAIAEAWARWIDGSYAFARAASTVIAGIGQTAWAEAYACTSASEDSASAYAESKVTGPENGDNTENNDDAENNDGSENGGDSTNNDPVGTNPVKISKPKLDVLSGFIFGGSDIERYCVFKLHAEDDDPDNDGRAIYYMKIIAWEYGYTTEEFENKYKLTCKN